MQSKMHYIIRCTALFYGYTKIHHTENLYSPHAQYP